MSYPEGQDEYLNELLSQSASTSSQQDAENPHGTVGSSSSASAVSSSFSSIGINFNTPSVFTDDGLRSTQETQSEQQQFQTSPYDITNIPSSMDPLFALGGVLGTEMAPVVEPSGSAMPSSLSSAGVSSSAAPAMSSSSMPSTVPPSMVGSLPQAPTPAGMTTNFPGLYSSTGFDMIGVLARVASRPNPVINLGPVDMSCSFLVVDAKKSDFPIVYASHTFEKLTGYSNAEIIGRNCRFLQAPDGHVAVRSRRRCTDNNAVFYIKTHVDARKECQVSIINYRKGGQPFINLVTVIPITWDSDDVRFFVGFQVDLVDQPNAILDKMKDGTYVVNYQLINLSPYISTNPVTGADVIAMEDYFRDSGNSMPFPATPEVLDLIGSSSDGEVNRRALNKLLLEQSDDFIHVLSLKGIFLYSSPSCLQMLEYEPEELVGQNLSIICHPSDIVPVMRELKESSNSAEAVSLVYRIRRKHSGYQWIEAHGKLHLEQGKGRKCVILSARRRPVYQLQWKDLQITGGISDHEFWSKLSLDGMFLYASSTCQNLLGISSEELVGVSLYQLVKSDRTTDITRTLSQARAGVVRLNHHIKKKNGQYAEFKSVFYPGDSNGSGGWSSFIICQAKEITSPSLRSTSSASTEASSTSSGGSTTTQIAHLGDLSEHQPTDNIFEELSTARGSSWQYELHQMRHTNKKLREELESILQSRKKRKKRGTPSSSSNKSTQNK